MSLDTRVTFSLAYTPKSGDAGLQYMPIFNFTRYWRYFPMLYQFISPLTIYESSCSTFLPTLRILNELKFTLCIPSWWLSHVYLKRTHTLLLLNRGKRQLGQIGWQCCSSLLYSLLVLLMISQSYIKNKPNLVLI